MNKILSILLKKYDPNDRELFLKAKFVLTATLLSILILSLALTYTRFFLASNTPVIITESLGFMMLLFGLTLLIKGNYTSSIHSLLISGFSTIWVVLFLDPSPSLIIKMDTIVYVIGLLCVMPLLFFKNRRPMVIYSLVNLLVYFGFNYYLSVSITIDPKDHMDYFLDNLLTISFVIFVSFSLFSIYQQVLNSLRKELAERKKIEKALLESENRLSSHLQNTPVGAISWDLDFKVTQWNPAAEKIFGYTREEAMGRSADIIVSREMKQMVGDIFLNLLAGRGGTRNTNENQTKTGGRIICDWYNTILKNIDGQVIGIASLVNDITDLKRTQDRMIQSEKMMSIGGLAAGMAHEINNPLAGMIQNSQVIYNRLTKELPSNIKVAQELGTSMTVIKNFVERRDILKQLENINQAGAQAVRIIENMLSFARKSDSTRDKHHLNELVDRTLELAHNDYDLKKKYDFKQIDIIREYAKDCPKVLCEASKIQQVVFNIIQNASQAMWEEKGQKKPTLMIRLYICQGMACIEIKDNGPGMEDAVRKRIFEPFFTTKPVDKGTGLGLSISYFIIVDDHGGELNVESTLKDGTTFIIKLPVN